MGMIATLTPPPPPPLLTTLLYPITLKTSIYFKNARSTTPTSRVTTGGRHHRRPPPQEAATSKATSKGGNLPWRPQDSLSDTESLPTNCFIHNIESPSPTNIRSIQSRVYDRYTNPPPPPTISNASLSHNSKYVHLLQERTLNNPDFPRHHRRPPPVKAAARRQSPMATTRQPKRHRITAYELFHAQYRIPVPNQYPKYTIPCVRSLH